MRKLDTTGKKHTKRGIDSVKMYMLVFMNMVAEKLWNNTFTPGVLALPNSVASDNERFIFRSDQKHIKMNLF
jgi:hypothetical protein